MAKKRAQIKKQTQPESDSKRIETWLRAHGHASVELDEIDLVGSILRLHGVPQRQYEQAKKR